MEHFIARQPIFDRNLKVFGYELLFRTSLENFFTHHSQEEAAVSVIANSSLLFGIEEMAGNARAFVNVTRGVLLNNFAGLLPRQFTILELLENVEPDSEVIRICRRLKDLGFILALDDFVYRPQYDLILDLIDIIKVDFLSTKEAERKRLAEIFIPRGIKMLAEKVETHEDFIAARNMGYTYFQGYFFSRPVIVSRKDLPIYKLQYLRILKEVSCEEINFSRLAQIIQVDVSISYKLLKYINSVAFGLRKRVTSILQALALLGEMEIKKWVALLSLTGMASDKPTELVMSSLVRAKSCELLAPMLSMSLRRSDLFLLGLFSLLDAIMDRPLEEILTEIHLEDDVQTALLHREGPLGTLLDMVIAMERGQWSTLSERAQSLGLDERSFPALHLQAVQWARETYSLDSNKDTPA